MLASNCVCEVAQCVVRGRGIVVGSRELDLDIHCEMGQERFLLD
jgi:hypothetical protein